MKKTTDITALGELLIDFTQAGVSDSGQLLFERNPGGAPANVLAAASRLGLSAAFIGKVGGDMHGEFLRETLVDAGINAEGLIVSDEAFTTLAFVALGENGERSFSFARKPGADTLLHPAELPVELIRNSHVFHVGSLSLCAEPARSATLVALHEARQAGCVISYDPNYRPALWKNEEEAVESMRSLLPYAHMVKISDEEAEMLTGFAEPEAAAAAILEQGACLVAVTLGAGGAYIALKNGRCRVAGYKVAAVDTTGAGDAFWGALIFALVRSGKKPDELTADDAVRFAKFANAAAALCVSKRGAIPAMPTLAEVDKFMKEC